MKLLETFQNDPSMMWSLVSIEAFCKKITDTLIKSANIIDSMKYNVRRIVLK